MLSALVLISSIAGAVITAPVCVFALSAGGIQSTIASIIISLMLQCGVAPVNTNYLNALNTSYGYTIESAITEGLLTETASGLVDSGLSAAIEGASTYSELGLSDIFTTTAADVGVTAASGGVNIANTAINVGTAGTIGAFAGAAAVGVGAGVLINHLRETIGNYIKYGFPMDENTRNTIINNIPSGYSKVYYGVWQYRNVYSDFYFVNGDCICVAYPLGNYGYSTKIQSKETGVAVPAKRLDYTNSTLNGESEYDNISSGPSMGNNAGIKLLKRKVDFTANSLTEANQIINDYRIGNIELPVTIAPDIIGPEGNQYYDAENDTFPGLVNQIPEGSDMVPVDMNDYQTYIDNANSNTNNGDTGQPIQGEGFDNFISPYIVDAPVIPDTPIIPDQPIDVPTVPDRPVTPDQPTMPNKPDLTDQEVQEALNAVTTIDLRSVFPFCIPFDLYNILLIFDTGENRKAPHITFTFPFTGWVIDVDLEPFDPVAGILRLLELILFIIGLAVATRSLIGAEG